MTDDAGTYSDAIGSLIDQTKRLAKAEAEVTRLRAVVARVETFAQSHAIACHALGRSDREREWLDLLAILERAPQPTTPDLADTRARADAEEASA